MRISDWSSDVCSSDLPDIAKPGIEGQGAALFRLGEEEADIRPRRGEIAASQTAKKGRHQQDEVGCVGVLHRIADAESRDQRQRGRSRSPETAAEDRHQESVADAQRDTQENGTNSETKQQG